MRPGHDRMDFSGGSSLNEFTMMLLQTSRQGKRNDFFLMGAVLYIVEQNRSYS